MSTLDFPPPTLHVFMGSYAPSSQGHGPTQQDRLNYFQDYRNETLSRFVMPTYHWGYTRTPYSPKADLAGSYRNANWKKMLETPSVKPRLIDESRTREVDNFYELCQIHRDQYRDHTGRLHPVRYFQNIDDHWNAPNMTKTYISFPTKFVEYRKPLVLPKTYSRTVPLVPLPNRSLTGRYSAGNDNAYNR